MHFKIACYFEKHNIDRLIKGLFSIRPHFPGRVKVAHPGKGCKHDGFHRWWRNAGVTFFNPILLQNEIGPAAKQVWPTHCGICCIASVKFSLRRWNLTLVSDAILHRNVKGVAAHLFCPPILMYFNFLLSSSFPFLHHSVNLWIYFAATEPHST